MDDWVSQLATGLLWAEDIASARRGLRDLAARLGVTYYTYGNSRPGLQQPYIDSTYPAEWMAHYFASGYQFIDPVLQQAGRSHLPFDWRFLASQGGGLDSAQRRLFDEAAAFGIRDGFTIPFHDDGECVAVLCYAFSSHDELEAAMRAQAKLKLLAVYYHTVVERLLAVRAPDGALSPMERQCLTEMAHGHSLWEISGRVHRPEPDVAGALRSAREKLGTATTAQAVVAALNLGLIAV